MNIKKVGIILLLAAGVLVLTHCSSSQPQAAPVPQQEAEVPASMQEAPEAGAEAQSLQIQAAPLVDEMSADNDGKKLLEERCVKCHDLGRTTSKKKTAEGWKATVERMVGKGAVLNAEEQQVLIDYLAKTYPQE